MKKRTLFLSLIALMLYSCETSSPESSIPTDSAGVDTNVDPQQEVVVDYFKILPPKPSIHSELKQLIIGSKWVVADYKVKNIEKGVVPPGVTEQTIHDESLFPIRDFSFTPNADASISIQKAQLGECNKRTFEINVNNNTPVLTVECQDNHFESNFEILGINEELIYLKEGKGHYPFEVFYIMKKE